MTVAICTILYLPPEDVDAVAGVSASRPFRKPPQYTVLTEQIAMEKVHSLSSSGSDNYGLHRSDGSHYNASCAPSDVARSTRLRRALAKAANRDSGEKKAGPDD